MSLSSTQFRRMGHSLATEGGFTVNPFTGDAVTSGVSVAPLDNERVVPPNHATMNALSDYHSSNSERFKRGASMGGWRGPDGSDYLDTPTVYPNTPGGQSRARNQVIKSDQIASFDLDNLDEQFSPFHPEGRKARGMEPHELAGSTREGMTTEQRRKRADWLSQQPEVQAWVNSPRMQR